MSWEDKRRGPGTPVLLGTGDPGQDYGPAHGSGYFRRRPGGPLIPLGQVRKETQNRTPGFNYAMSPGMRAALPPNKVPPPADHPYLHQPHWVRSRSAAGLGAAGFGEVPQVYGSKAKGPEEAVIAYLKGQGYRNVLNAEVTQILRLTQPGSDTFASDMKVILTEAKKYANQGEGQDNGIVPAVNALRLEREQQRQAEAALAKARYNRRNMGVVIGAIALLAALNYAFS